jgi:hypothetical protein
VTSMTHCDSFAPLGPEFNRFLFTPIGEDGNGLLLTVLSALARLDLDPWQEAHELTLLPKDAAVRRLTAAIAPSVTGGPSTDRDPRSTADRLIALLPRRDAVSHASGITLPAIGKATRSRAALYVYFLAMAVTMGAQIFIATRVPQEKLDTTPTSFGHAYAGTAWSSGPDSPPAHITATSNP